MSMELRPVSGEALQVILAEHGKWVVDKSSGSRADLRDADLWGARLLKADLREACLRGACLRDASLRGACLQGADLRDASLQGAILVDTCLDPDNAPNGDAVGFSARGDHVVGYRTEAAGHIDKYRVGRVYSVDWFSTADTECHPGLYLWPTKTHARDFSGDVPLIEIETDAADIHHAGTKWRARWFRVIKKL